MMILHLIMAIFASFRFVILITEDRIIERVRKLWPGYLWTCPYCVSVWAGAIATLLIIVAEFVASLRFMAFVNWPFAMSWLYLLLDPKIRNRILNRVRGEIHITQGIDGNVIVDAGGMNKENVLHVLRGLVDASNVTGNQQKQTATIGHNGRGNQSPISAT